MAKIKFSALVSDIRNSLNGSTFARNRGGNYFRNKTTPINRQTPAQMTLRNAFGSISQAWQGLTDAQRQTWNDAVGDYAYTDQFGDTRNLSGAQLHQKLNQNLAVVGIAPILEAPLKVPVFQLGSASVITSEATQDMDLTLTPGPLPAGVRVVVQATRPLSAGRAFMKNEYRTIHIINGGTSVSNLDISSFYAARFATYVAGQRIGFRVWVVDTATGLKSPDTSFDILALP